MSKIIFEKSKDLNVLVLSTDNVDTWEGVGDGHLELLSIAPLDLDSCTSASLRCSAEVDSAASGALSTEGSLLEWSSGFPGDVGGDSPQLLDGLLSVLLDGIWNFVVLDGSVNFEFSLGLGLQFSVEHDGVLF
jgi:hypothetical protein